MSNISMTASATPAGTALRILRATCCVASAALVTGLCSAQPALERQANTRYETIKPLVEQAIRTGAASGSLVGAVAADFNKNIGLSEVNPAPITAYLSLLERLSPSCGRVSFDMSRPGQTALAPDGKQYPQRIVWAMNICTSGIPSPTGAAAPSGPSR